MEMKIGEIAKRSGVPPSTIRYYVRQGLLPEPTKVNKSMAYYDEGCIQRIQAIRHLQETKYFPLPVIRNILRRMDEGLSLEEAEAIEDARKGRMATTIREDGKPEGIGSELADIVIRVCDSAGALGIDMEAELRAKLAFNRTRSHKHGGKLA